MKTEEIKTWRDRITTPTTNQKNLFMSMQAEIDELREAFANLHSDYDIIEIDRDELQAKLAESEKCLQDSIDCNLNKLLAMTDEQVTALTRLEGSNPEEVAALARKTMELAVVNVNLNEYSRLYEAALKREFDLAQKLVALEKQQPIAWIYAWECEGELITDWMTTDNAEAHSLSNECHNIRPLFLAAGAAPVHKEPVAWRAWNSQHHCYDYGEASETDALGRVVEYLCLEGEV